LAALPLHVTAGAAGTGIGVLVIVRPMAGIGAALALVPIALLTLREGLRPLLAWALAALLTGYMFLDRGFAHVGAPPLYVGDAVLGLAFLTVVAVVRRPRLTALHWLVIAFMGLGAARTIPFLSTDGTTALRDATIWGYAAFALALSFILVRADVTRVLGWYRKLVIPFLCWAPLGLLATTMLSIPAAPGSDVSLVSLKGGDIAVQLAGIAAFVLLGLYSGDRPRLGRETLLWPLWVAGVAIAGSGNRGGLLAIMLAVGVVLALRVRSARRIGFVAAIAVVVVVASFVNPSVGGWGARSVSLGQLERNALSIGGGGGGSLNGTREFRLRWWSKIAHYTFEGPYFWTGKGFGINLADSDGFQVAADHSLRAPHNTHMTVLARMGVPGLALWAMLQIGFGASLLRATRRARRTGERFWTQVNSWIFVLWLAMLVNTSFDPYLEGPQGSIWFWCVFGFGLAVLRLQRERSDATEAPA
jgi:hypothetical protein